MDPFVAREMVEALSHGLNPATGKALSRHDCCCAEEVQAALAEVLAHCTIEPAEQTDLFTQGQSLRQIRAAQNTRRYPRRGERWSRSEEQLLLTALRRGKNIYQIAASLKRTPAAISDRIKSIQRRQTEAEASSGVAALASSGQEDGEK